MSTFQIRNNRRAAAYLKLARYWFMNGNATRAVRNAKNCVRCLERDPNTCPKELAQIKLAIETIMANVKFC